MTNYQNLYLKTKSIENLDENYLNSLLKDFAETHDQSLRDELIIYYIKIVPSIAKKFHYDRSVYDVEDIIGYGIIGLENAIDNYSVNENAKFTTYATTCISNSISQYLNRSNVAKLPSGLRVEYSKIKNYIDEYRCNNEGRKPSAYEVYNHFDQEIELLTISELMDYFPLKVSLDEPLDSDTNSTLLDVLEDKEDLCPIDYVEQQEIKERADSILSRLSKEERIILMKRMGYNGFKEQTYKEIADDLGIKESTVERMYKKAIARIRRESTLVGGCRSEY